MGRHKKDITKSTYIKFRVEPELRRVYFSICRKNKKIPSKELRLIVENICNK